MHIRKIHQTQLLKIFTLLIHSSIVKQLKYYYIYIYIYCYFIVIFFVDNKISNARTLFSYFDASTSTTSKSGNIVATIIPSSWLISIMYILQWCIALLLCSWACYKKHIHVHLFNYSYYWSKSRNTVISSYEVKSHFRQANLAISQVKYFSY